MPYHNGIYYTRERYARMVASGEPLIDRSAAELKQTAEALGVKPKGRSKQALADAIEGAATPPATGTDTTRGGD